MHPFAVVYRRAGEGYSARVPALPGCRAFGATLAEAERNVNAAIQARLSRDRTARRPATPHPPHPEDRRPPPPSLPLFGPRPAPTP